MTRSANAQISFADLEFLDQGVRLEPILQAISDFIDQHCHLVDRVRRDLVRGLKNPKTGRMLRISSRRQTSSRRIGAGHGIAHPAAITRRRRNAHFTNV